MIQVNQYRSDVDRIANQVIDDIRREMQDAKEDELMIESPVDDVYKVYLQDDEVKVSKAASCIEYLSECDLNTILRVAERINERLNKSTARMIMFRNLTYGRCADYVHCNDCETDMLVPCGMDKCPLCGSDGNLSWVDADNPEIDLSTIPNEDIEYKN